MVHTACGVATFFGKTDVGVFWVCISLWMMTFYRLVMGMAKESVRRDDADDAFERFMRIRNELDANEGRPDLIN